MEVKASGDFLRRQGKVLTAIGDALDVPDSSRLIIYRVDASRMVRRLKVVPPPQDYLRFADK
ncbi:hypothetical protein [Bifidobacterium bohemicum]|uniref:hypothetical protein n=1 Tax=Bifidobacterium bohemicum TaxID=638617 RepID=UPI00094357CF|nr:hypothetical protein [Bifidobacterium bohemicum]